MLKVFLLADAHRCLMIVTGDRMYSDSIVRASRSDSRKCHRRQMATRGNGTHGPGEIPEHVNVGKSQ